ncbi:MAG: MarR family transcriptional regulator [Verrucomicrobia bacterium]|nr:MarR family transcriptional regulator [Verrucomicrobiota bacterium]
MPLLMLKDLPRYECLLEAAREFPDLDPSATEVFLHLLRAGDEAFRVVESHLAQHDITQGRFGVLMALWGNDRGGEVRPPLSPATLAERTGVTRATMTGLIDTLERDGLVRREPDPADRRMMTVKPTRQAVALLTRILPGHFQRMAALMLPLTESEREVLVSLLQKIANQASTLSPTGDGSAAPTAEVAARG